MSSKQRYGGNAFQRDGKPSGPLPQMQIRSFGFVGF